MTIDILNGVSKRAFAVATLVAITLLMSFVERKRIADNSSIWA